MFFKNKKLQLLEEENKILKEENILLKKQLKELIIFIDSQIAQNKNTTIGRKQKFNEKEKINIQNDYKKIKSLRKIAKKYNTSRTTIQRIVSQNKK